MKKLYMISFYLLEDFSESANQLQMNYETYVSEDEFLFKVVFAENATDEKALIRAVSKELLVSLANRL